MAGITMVYFLGGAGGYLSADGINPVEGMILVGDGNRRWYECRYLDSPGKSLGKIKSMVPAHWDNPDNLLDALIVFFPRYFEACPAFPSVAESLAECTMLDFDAAPPADSVSWEMLREQARKVLPTIIIWKADLVFMKFEDVDKEGKNE